MLRAARGFTLIEIAIALVIAGVLLMTGLPAFTTFLQNTQIKNAAQTTLDGIMLARAEAVRRNALVRFELVSSLTSGCAASATSLNWVVSRGDPASHCDAAPAAADDSAAPTGTDPKIIQKKSGQEGTRNVTLSTTGGAVLQFNGLGRVVGSGITQLNFYNPTGGTCEHIDTANGTMRCLRILVSTGGQAKLCDPKITDAIDPGHIDPRRCS